MRFCPRHPTILLTMAALAVCAPPSPRTEEASPSGPSRVAQNASHRPPPSPPTPTGPGYVYGQWRLVHLSGVELPASPVVHVLIGHGRIDATSQCVPFHFSLRREAAGVTVSSLPFRGPVCARGLSPAETAFPRVMTAVRALEGRPDRRVAFVGEGGEAVLERPDAPVTNPFGSSSDDPFLMWGAWRVVAVGDAPVSSDAPIDLIFAGQRVEAKSGCVPMLWSVSEGNGITRAVRGVLTLTPRPWPEPVCQRLALPAETALRRVLAGEVRITRSTPSERLLASRGGTVLLRR